MKLPKIGTITNKIGRSLLQGAKAGAGMSLQNMGTLGHLINTQINKAPDASLIHSQKRVPEAKDQKEKDIKAKPAVTLDQLFKQAHDAIDVTIQTTNKGFVFVGKHMDIFGTEVSRSLDSFHNLLTRMLYQKKAAPMAAAFIGGGGRVQNNSNKKDDGLGWGSMLAALLSAKSAFNFLKLGLKKLTGKGAVDVLKKPGLLKGLLGPMKAMGKFALKKLPFVGLAMGAYDLHDASKSNNSAFEDYTSAAIDGATALSFLGPEGAAAGAALGLGAMFFIRSFKQTGNIGSLEINKIIFDVGKVKFNITNTLEFKKRVLDATKSSGVFNDAADAIRGGRGGAGSLNTILDSMRGGPGGAGMFNTLADKVFGTGPKNNAARTGSGGISNRGTTRVDQGGPDKVSVPSNSALKDYTAGKERLGHAGGHIDGVNTKLLDLMKQASKDLPDGYHAEIISGHDARSTGTKNHPNGLAADIKIYDQNGKLIPYDRGGPGMKFYEQFHQSIVERGKVKYPNDKFIWGGTWQSRAAGNGDPMHQQIVDPTVPGSSQSSGAYNDDKGAHGHPFEPYLMTDEERKAYKQSIRDKIKKEQTTPTPTPKENTPQSFGNIPPGLNDVMSKDQTIPWTKDGWSWMRRSTNMEDRRNEPDPYKDDPYSIAEKERAASLRTWEPDLEKESGPTLLGNQLGLKNLNPVLTPLPDITPPPDLDEPPSQKQSFYQGTENNSMDHRTERKIKTSDTFATYFSTANNTEDA